MLRKMLSTGSDWEYQLKGDYYIMANNSKDHYFAKQQYNAKYNNNDITVLVSNFVTEFWNNDNIVIVKQVPKENYNDIGYDDSIFDEPYVYYIFNMNNEELFGPYAVEEYSVFADKVKELDDAIDVSTIQWIKTRPRPEGAIYW